LVTLVAVGALGAGLDAVLHRLGREGDDHSTSEQGFVVTLGLAVAVQSALSWWFGPDVLSVGSHDVKAGLVVSGGVVCVVIALSAGVLLLSTRRVGVLGKIQVLTLPLLTSIAVCWAGAGASAHVPGGRLITTAGGLLTLFAAAVAVRTTWGLRWRAVVSSRSTALLRGLDLNRFRLVAVFFASAAVGLLGSLHSTDVGVRQESGDRFLVGAAFVGLLSSDRSVSRSVMAAAAYSTITYLAVRLVSSAWADAAGESLLFVALAVRAALKPVR
jgi:branched-subunit amino acid ABC-type transport system permease component